MLNKLLTLALAAISTEAMKLDALPLFDNELAQTDDFEGWEDYDDYALAQTGDFEDWDWELAQTDDFEDWDWELAQTGDFEDWEDEDWE